MAPDNQSPPEAVIFEPDQSLKDKLGPNISFGQIVPPETIHQAEKIIIDSRQVMLNEINIEIARIDRAVSALRPGQYETTALKRIGDCALAIVPKAGMCDYLLAARLAKILHEICEHEDIGKAHINPHTLAIFACLVEGIKTTVEHNITGDGGAIGATILDELSKLTSGHDFS
ncbi:MAG: hypothetical protein ABTQ34_00380 [Bdellovibrionales bacterium]